LFCLGSFGTDNSVGLLNLQTPREVLQPDLFLCGGLRDELEILTAPESFAAPLHPHVFCTVINFVGSLQLAKVLPDTRLAQESNLPWFELDQSDNPLRALLGWPKLNSDGTLSIPDGPGLGIELSRENLGPYVRQAYLIC
jgi:D-galactarolactone cycloisomerase